MSGERLRLAREARGISQADLARRVGLQRSAISHIEHGRRLPSFDNLRHLSEVLGVSADYLLGLIPTMAGAGLPFRGGELLSDHDREIVQAMIDTIGQRRSEG